MKNKKIFWLIFIFTAIRLLMASVLELGRDEAYYYTFALHLQPNYIDHPPAVAYLIKLFSFNLLVRDEIFIRLGAIVCAAAGTFLCFRIGETIKNQRTGFFAAVLYNTSIYTSVIAGTFILPDSPYVVFWLGALLVMCKMSLDISNDVRISIRKWLAFGILSGGCILCKIDGAFLWFGMLIFIFISNWKYLFHPGIYLGLFISMVIISPVIAWNINNNFVSWNYYSSLFSPGVSVNSFIRIFLGQLIYNNPVNSFIIVTALIACFRKKISSDLTILVLLCTGLPVILLTTGMSFIVNVLPHWSGPGFLALSFLGAIWLDEKVLASDSYIPALLKYAVVVIFVVITTGSLAVRLFPGTAGQVSAPDFGKDDLTLNMWGWRKFNHLFGAYRERERLKGHILPNTLVSNKWASAAQLEYYVAYPFRMELSGVGRVRDLQHFVWLNRYRPDLKKGVNALTIVPSDYTKAFMSGYEGYFKNVRLLNTFSVERNGEPARYFCLYLLEEYLQNDEAHTKTPLAENIACSRP